MSNELLTESYAFAFDKYRSQPDFIISKYVNIFYEQTLRYRNKIQVLDAGCGSGQFAVPFSKAIKSKAGKLTAVDSSKHMINLLEKKCELHELNNLITLNEDIINIGSEYRFDLIWMSDFIHLFDSLEKLLSILNGAIYDDASLMIRFSSLKQLKSYEWGDYFPSALNFDLDRHHENKIIIESLQKIGFSDVLLQEINETRMVSYDEYINFFRNKYLSSLSIISKNEFNKGINAMEKNYQNQKKVKRNAKTSLLIARRKKR